MNRATTIRRYASLLAVCTLTVGVVVASLPGSATAGPGDWIKTRQDVNYHMVSQWSDYTQPGFTLPPGVEPYPQHPHASNPTVHQWTFDDEVTNTWSNGILAPGESVSFSETYLSDGVERVNQAQASGRSGPLQVTVTVANQFHSRSSTEMGETCVVGPAYPHLVWWDHTNPYGSWIEGSNVGAAHDPPLPPDYPADDGGWAVDHTTITVTVTNTGTHTAREVSISSLIGRPYAWLPPQRPAACDGLPITPAVGNEPQWRS